MNGLDVCKTLKRQPETQDIPIIFITAHQSKEDETNCWEAGGIDFVTKPINPTTLLNRIKVHLKLIYQTKLLRELAFTDGLTGIANRRYFDEQLSLYFRQCQRNKKPLALIMIDIDLFKTYNDHYGHQAGDESLKKMAHLLKSKMRRPNDLAARYGGEEFVCLLPETDEVGAQTVAKQLQSSVAKLAIQHEESTVTPILTISMGIAVLIPSNSNSTSALIAEADARLYQAKQQGRNCIISPQNTE
jgi:diguanylate cyclase (GGDEF)-like protein